MNWWLTRPIGVLEQVIARLGESRLDESVVVHGPDDLRQVGRRLDWLRMRLRDLEADRERTLRHVSHELKTPLTALREGVDLLKDEIGGPLGATQHEIVAILQHNVITLQGHIESLLRLNAVAGEARRLRKRPVRLDSLLDHVVQGRALQIQARQLVVQCLAPPLTCLLDDEKLAVALDNLLSNAIEFSPEGGLIRLEASTDGDELRSVCADQGAGVDPADAARIFEPFVQGQRLPPLPRQGSGVGLSIVRELMTARGGTVRLASFADDADGAVFRIALPCERASEQSVNG